jgi:hypothetical protein
MAVKAVLTSLEGVPDSLKGEYTKGEGGVFFLSVEGLEDGAAVQHPAVAALANTMRNVKVERDKAATASAALKAESADIKARYEALSTEHQGLLKGTVPKDNIAALEKSWEEKRTRDLAEVTKVKDTEIGDLSTALNSVLVDSQAQALAAKLVKDPIHIPVLLPFIKSRLTIERKGTEASTRVLDAEGKPSASTLDDLGKEIVGDPKFAVILLGSKASGGGANQGHGGGGAPPVKDVDKVIASPATSPADLARALRAKRATTGG